MAAPLGAFVMRDAIITIDLVEYANQITAATCTPEQETLTIRTLVPDGVVQDVDTPVFTLALAGIQDFVVGQGLARYLWDNDGNDIDVVLEPRNGGVGFTMVCVAKSPPIGGEQGAWATVELTLPVKGRPTPVDPI